MIQAPKGRISILKYKTKKHYWTYFRAISVFGYTSSSTTCNSFPWSVEIICSYYMLQHRAHTFSASIAIVPYRPISLTWFSIDWSDGFSLLTRLHNYRVLNRRPSRATPNSSLFPVNPVHLKKETKNKRGYIIKVYDLFSLFW